MERQFHRVGGHEKVSDGRVDLRVGPMWCSPGRAMGKACRAEKHRHFKEEGGGRSLVCPVCLPVPQGCPFSHGSRVGSAQLQMSTDSRSLRETEEQTQRPRMQEGALGSCAATSL